MIHSFDSLRNTDSLKKEKKFEWITELFTKSICSKIMIYSETQHLIPQKLNDALDAQRYALTSFETIFFCIFSKLLNINLIIELI